MGKHGLWRSYRFETRVACRVLNKIKESIRALRSLDPTSVPRCPTTTPRAWVRRQNIIKLSRVPPSLDGLLKEFSPFNWDVRYLILGLIGAGIIISGHNEVQTLLTALRPFSTALRKAILTKMHACERIDNIKKRVMGECSTQCVHLF
jgi:hypothetical protein